MATVEEILAMADADRSTGVAAIPSAADLTYDPSTFFARSTRQQIGDLPTPTTQTPAPLSRGELLLKTLQGGLGSTADVLTLGAFTPATARTYAGLSSLLTGEPYETQLGRMEEELQARKELYREAAGSVPGGSVLGIPISDVAASFASPIDRIRRLQQAREVAGPIGRLAIDAAIGGGTAATTAALSSDVSPMQREQAVEDAAQLGAILGGGGSVLGAALSRLGPRLTEEGMRMRRSSLGARQSDYQKVATRAGTTIPAENAALNEAFIDLPPTTTPARTETIAKQNLNDLLFSGELGSSRQSSEMAATAQQKLNALAGEVDNVITRFEQTNTKSLPKIEFNRATKFLESGRAGDKADQLLKDILDFEGRISVVPESQRLSFLQAEKRALARKYSVGDQTDADFGRAFYDDVKRYIENLVPDVGALNKQQSKLMTAMPILRRGLAQEEAFNLMGSLQRLGYTTGGVMAPAILGSGLTGDLSGAVTGGLLGLALRGAVTGKGKDIVGRGAYNLGQLVESLVPQNADILAMQAARPFATEAQVGVEQPKRDAEIQALLKPAPKAATTPAKASALSEDQRKRLLELRQKTVTKTAAKNDVQALVTGRSKLVQAVVAQESGGNAKAKSPAGAVGLMQLMPATAKAYGVTDRTDPQQSLDAGEKYLRDLYKQFDDVELTLAAYNWGPGNVRKALKKIKAKGQAETWDNVLRFASVPNETSNYVAKVLNNYQKLEG
jgi:hypothetical protein